MENNRLEQDISKMVSGIDSELRGLEDSSTPRMDEVMFREVFLPFFANDENPKYQVNLNKYLEFTTSPFKELDIVDNHGNVLFTVPPLYDGESIRILDPTGEKENKTRLLNVMSNANLLRNRSEAEAEKYVQANMVGRLAKVESKLKLFNYALRWNTIYSYYGREEPFPTITQEFIDNFVNKTVAPKVDVDVDTTSNDDDEWELA